MHKDILVCTPLLWYAFQKNAFFRLSSCGPPFDDRTAVLLEGEVFDGYPYLGIVSRAIRSNDILSDLQQ